jgi:site-specific DNA-cytosine methylase
LTAVDLVDITRPEAVIIEAPAALFVADNAKLFQQFTSKVDAINYVMHIITMEASKYGSLQARPRLYPVLIRRDIHESRRPFCGPSPSMLSQSTLRDVVLHADQHPDLPALRSTQHWIRIRDGASHLTSYKGPRCELSTEGEGTACKGYSLDGSARTQTGSDTHIFDDRLGYVRKLHEQERLDIIGQPGLRFPSNITDDKRRHLIGQTMDAKCVGATIEYLDSGCIPAAMRTALDIHCDAKITRVETCRAKWALHFPRIAAFALSANPSGHHRANYRCPRALSPRVVSLAT